MHTSEEYGYLSCGGRPLEVRELSRLIPTTEDAHQAAHQEFLQKGLLLKDQRGVLFSPYLIDQRRQGEANTARVQKHYAKHGRKPFGKTLKVNGIVNADVNASVNGEIREEKTRQEDTIERETRGPTLSEWLSHSKDINWSSKPANAAFHKLEAIGWKANGQPIINWRAIAKSYAAREKNDLPRKDTLNPNSCESPPNRKNPWDYFVARGYGKDQTDWERAGRPDPGDIKRMEMGKEPWPDNDYWSGGKVKCPKRS